MIREFHQISLRTRNSFGVDQQAARLIEFETPEDLRTLFAAGIPEKWTVLAGGNNILFTRDYDGLLLTPAARGIAVTKDEGDRVYVRAEAGVEWDDLVEWAVERGLWGIENLSLIPGKAGSAPVQNIGAYGCEAKDAIRRVEMYCVETGNLLTLDAAHCGFGYRESVFKHDLKGRVIITAIEIRLSHTPRPKLGYGDVEREVEARGGATLRNIREAICSIGRAGQRGQLLQESRGRSPRRGTAPCRISRHAALCGPRRPRKAGRRVADRPGRDERLPRGKRGGSRAAGAGAGEPRRRHGRRGDRLRPHGAGEGPRKIRHRNRY